MRDRAPRERDWFYSRVGMLRLAALTLVCLAIAGIVGMMLFGLLRGAVR